MEVSIILGGFITLSLQESKTTAQSCWEGVVAFNNEWMLAPDLRFLSLVRANFSVRVSFFAIFSLRCIILLLNPRHRLVWDGRHHGLGERKQPDHERRCYMGRNNGVPPIPPHDHRPAVRCIYQNR